MKQAVLFMASYAAPYEGNFIPSLRQLGALLTERGLVSVLVLPQEAAQYSWVKQQDWCHRIYHMPGSLMGDRAVFAQVMRDYDVRLIYTHFAVSRQIISLKLARKPGIPIVEHHHAQYPQTSNPLKRSLKCFIMQGDYLLGCSQAVAEGLRRGGLKNDISYVENAVDFTRLGDFSPKARGNTVLMFGYDFLLKGVDVALLACAKLAPDFPDFRLRVCAAVELERVRQQTVALLGSVPPWLELLPPTPSVGDYYRQAQIFLSASRHEGFCYALVESSYCGCLPVSSRIDGPAQIAIPGIRWFPSEDSEALSAVLRETLTLSEVDRIAQAQAVHRDAVAGYRLERWAQQTTAFLDSRKLL